MHLEPRTPGIFTRETCQMTTIHLDADTSFFFASLSASIDNTAASWVDVHVCMDPRSLLRKSPKLEVFLTSQATVADQEDRCRHQARDRLEPFAFGFSLLHVSQSSKLSRTQHYFLFDAISGSIGSRKLAPVASKVPIVMNGASESHDILARILLSQISQDYQLLMRAPGSGATVSPTGSTMQGPIIWLTPSTARRGSSGARQDILKLRSSPIH